MYPDLKIALVQMNCKLMDVSYNVEHALALAGEAAVAGAKLICLPETFSTGYNLDCMGSQLPSLSESLDGPTVTKMKAFCKKHQVYLAGAISCYHTNPSDKPNICCFFLSPDGELLGVYDKNHLFGDEKKYFAYGKDYPVFETKYGKIGIMVCYDANFPEPARILALQGAQIILCPAAWRVDDIRLFDMIMPQRAAENIAYVCAANRFGADEGRYNPGHSQVCSPLGEVLSVAGEEETILYYTLNADTVTNAREKIPYLRDLRYEEYLPYFTK